MSDDIVTRLQEMLDGPVPFVVGREDIREALNEIERLREEAEGEQAMSNVFESLAEEAAAEIERLRTKIENLQAHIQWLTQVSQERIHG